MLPVIAVLGASGLIGEAVARSLIAEGFSVVAVARRFTAAQRAAFGSAAVEAAFVDMGAGGLGALLAARDVEIAVNCVGILQDGPRGRTADVHEGFAARLTSALQQGGERRLLVQLTIPRGGTDSTAFSRTKRGAEAVIAASGVPYVIVRPGFVVGPAAYGGSALIRALAALPIDLPEREANSPFAVTDVADIGRTIAVVARQWSDRKHALKADWDVLEARPGTVADVIAAFRAWLGGPSRAMRLPSWLLGLGAKVGDLAAVLGWSPPIRSTALAEMRRGVSGNPGPWIAATGLRAAPLKEVLGRYPASVQEKWFARLYLIKPVAIGGLALFWVVSGWVALTAGFEAAVGLLTAHGVAEGAARALMVVTGWLDIVIGLAIAVRRTARPALVGAIALSLGYMLAAAVWTPELWLDPLGPLVKTAPVIILMWLTLNILDER